MELRADLRGVRPEQGSLSLGLQKGSGTVSFDLASLTFEEEKPLFEFDEGTEPCAYSPRVKNQTPLRGIWGYDLINEPCQNRPAAPNCDYWTLQARAARLVRGIDPVTPIVIEANGWDSASQFRFLKPLELSDVIYQTHMYDPGYYTHQGVHAKSEKDWLRTPYPCAAKKLDKEFLRAALKPVLDFQRRHGAVIYVGEFSAITWAEGADAYLRDCISIFNEYGWHWTYHAFREWAGWSVEHEADGFMKFRPAADTPRKRALLEGLVK